MGHWLEAGKMHVAVAPAGSRKQARGTGALQGELMSPESGVGDGQVGEPDSTMRMMRTDMERQPSIDLVLVDFDDTLVDTAPRFEGARAELFRLLEKQGFERELVRTLHYDVVDPEMRRQYGFGPHRLSHAFRETYARLTRETGRPAHPEVLEHCASLAQSAIGTPPAIAGALPALRRLAAHLPTALYTQAGDVAYQLECVRGAGVLELLPESMVYICAHKTAAQFGETLAHFGVSDPARAWMVGNSIRNDINPALEAGANVILVEVEDPWTYDVVEPVRNGFPRVPTFAAAVDLLLQLHDGG